MKLGIVGAIALGLGIWALASWWWFLVEIVQALVAIGLVVSGALAIAIAARRLYRARQERE